MKTIKYSLDIGANFSISISGTISKACRCSPTRRIQPSLQRVFRRDVKAVSAMVVRPIVDRDCVSDVEIRSGAFPIGESALSVVEVEYVRALAEFGLQSGCADCCRTSDVQVFGVLDGLSDYGTAFGLKGRRVRETNRPGVQLYVDRRSEKMSGILV